MQTEKAIAFIILELRTGLSADLVYHNTQHTIEIIAAAGKLGQMEGIDGTDFDLLLTAAAFHDSGFLRTYEGHEIASCVIARDCLPDYSYTEDEIDQVCKMIMATEASTQPTTVLPEILCDADLDYLGRDDYLQISDRLRKEWAIRGHEYSQVEWLKFQISFLEKHHYYTSSARSIRDTGKEKNLISLRGRFRKLAAE